MKTTAGFLDVAGALQEVLRRDELAEILARGVRMLLRADAAGVRWIGSSPVSRSAGKKALLPSQRVHAAGFTCPAGPEGCLVLLATRRGRRFTRAEHALLDALRTHVVHVIARILEGEMHSAAGIRAAECLAAANISVLFRTAENTPLRTAGPFADGLLTAYRPDVAALLARATARLGAIDAQSGRRATEWTETDARGTLRFRVVTAPDGDLVTVEEIDREAESSAAAALGLPPRQSEVLHWMSKGKSYPEIAAILGIGLHTVHDHAAAIFRRLGVRDRRSAIRRLRLAERFGISPTPRQDRVR